MAQVQQLQDSQATIKTLYSQLFDLYARLYDIEHAHDRAELHAEMLEMKMTGSHHQTQKWHSPLLKAKTMVSEWYPNGGKSTSKWITDKKFGLYNDTLGLPDTGGPLCGYEARQHLLNETCCAVSQSKKVKNENIAHHEVSVEVY